MTFGSLFAGVGGFDLGLEQAGHHCRWQVENNSACKKVLARHFPGVARHSDIRDVKGEDLEPVDLICGGSPCQGLSVAGDRRGLDDERSGLWYEFWRVLTEVEPEWVLFENVPGLLSSCQGRDFAIVLAGLTGQLCEVPDGGWKSAGWARGWYNVCWRVLDSRFFGVAQRRRRVFIVARLATTGRSPLPVLFEPGGMPGNSAPGESKGEGAAAPVEGSAGETIAFGGRFASPVSVEGSGNAHGGHRYDMESETFVCFRDHGRLELHDTGPTLTQRDGTGGNNVPIVAQSVSMRGRNGGSAAELHDDTVSTDSRAHRTTGVLTERTVRRLSPGECEILQGFPAGWTDGQPDAHRYRQLGNAVTVNVARWIGNRLKHCEDEE